MRSRTARCSSRRSRPRADARSRSRCRSAARRRSWSTTRSPMRARRWAASSPTPRRSASCSMRSPSASASRARRAGSRSTTTATSRASNAVGAMVVAGPEGFQKNQYRKFNIRSADLTPGDDFAMMREVLERRFKRLLTESPRLPTGARRWQRRWDVARRGLRHPLPACGERVRRRVARRVRGTLASAALDRSCPSPPPSPRKRGEGDPAAQASEHRQR